MSPVPTSAFLSNFISDIRFKIIVITSFSTVGDAENALKGSFTSTSIVELDHPFPPPSASLKAGTWMRTSREINIWYYYFVLFLCA